MRNIATYLLCLLILVLPGCQVFTPQQRDDTEQKIEDAYRNKAITKAQRDAALEALNTAPDSFNWAGLANTGINVLLAALGVPVTVGMAATAVHRANAKAKKAA